MMKLNVPEHTSKMAISYCCKGITGNHSLLEMVKSAEYRFDLNEDGYKKHAINGDLYRIVPLPKSHDSDCIVLDSLVYSLTKSDLIKLYNSYFVKEVKPARVIYDTLMAAAEEKCPFCGGIGRPRNLDHYLPKTHFPQFSVLPINLIPSCRDCNMDGKGSDFASFAEEQVIHPYLDHNRFFYEQWIFASYIVGSEGEPDVIKYFCRPSEDWSDINKSRVKKHFKDFSLGLRYSKEASARLITIMEQIESIIKEGISSEVAKSLILNTIITNAPFVNHWERVMCITLMEHL